MTPRRSRQARYSHAEPHGLSPVACEVCQVFQKHGLSSPRSYYLWPESHPPWEAIRALTTEQLAGACDTCRHYVARRWDVETRVTLWDSEREF